MHGSVVLDSSIIAAIFFPEKISMKAIEVAEGNDGTTVDLAYAEVANVAWKRTIHSNSNAETVKTALTDSQAFIKETCRVIPAQDLVAEAFELSCAHRVTVYDALFLAAAARCGIPLVTADVKLYSAAREDVSIQLIR
ncbi:MAG: type II toxin-antitoxin system VapC family toxin [Methanolinea sp.]|jgi:predicted nucleic acid-binding protein|nr:type II toxin-antitoxin system VapC family toxin [Methanolinea sp.]